MARLLVEIFVAGPPQSQPSQACHRGGTACELRGSDRFVILLGQCGLAEFGKELVQTLQGNSLKSSDLNSDRATRVTVVDNTNLPTPCSEPSEEPCSRTGAR